MTTVATQTQAIDGTDYDIGSTADFYGQRITHKLSSLHSVQNYPQGRNRFLSDVAESAQRHNFDVTEMCELGKNFASADFCLERCYNSPRGILPDPIIADLRAKYDLGSRGPYKYANNRLISGDYNLFHTGCCLHAPSYLWPMCYFYCLSLLYSDGLFLFILNTGRKGRN